MAAALRRTCRLLIDRPAAGSWNMAVDEVLLESAAAGQATLRFYAWQPATLSLGYFQKLVDRRQHPTSQACPVVRRESGGGAIVHDRELTYSLALPVERSRPPGAAGLYLWLHRSLAEVLAELGIQAVTRAPGATALAEAARPATGDPAATEPRATGLPAAPPAAAAPAGSLPPEPFLCFQRRAAGDLVVAETKVCGSAQRRRDGAVLQHGSVLLERSPAAAELPGLREVTGQAIDTAWLIDRWVARLTASGALDFCPGLLSVAELEAAERWVQQRFANPAWTELR